MLRQRLPECDTQRPRAYFAGRAKATGRACWGTRRATRRTHGLPCGVTTRELPSATVHRRDAWLRVCRQRAGPEPNPCEAFTHGR